jgi:hypothetical protein
MKRIKLPPRSPDLTGQKFGKMTALFPVDDGTIRKNNPTHWMCRCDCGTEKSAKGYSLKTGQTTSCGCLKRERGIIFGTKSATHGMRFTPEWRAWVKMRERCYDKNNAHFDLWGGRGIIVCDRWRYAFENFFSDLGRRPSSDHSIDRFPNQNGNYEPGNVRWATRVEQMQNKRDNVMVTAFGRTASLAAFLQSGSKSPNYQALYRRIVLQGWAPEAAIRSFSDAV